MLLAQMQGKLGQIYIIKEASCSSALSSGQEGRNSFLCLHTFPPPTLNFLVPSVRFLSINLLTNFKEVSHKPQITSLGTTQISHTLVAFNLMLIISFHLVLKLLYILKWPILITRQSIKHSIILPN